MKLRIALTALAATALIGLSACGGDDDDDEPVAGTTTTEETTTEPSGDGGGGGGGGGTISLAADPGGALAYDTTSLEAGAGEVTIDFTNEASLPHDVRIEDDAGEELGGTDVIMESEETAKVDVEAGEYTFFCSVPGHREGGMEGTLTVE